MFLDFVDNTKIVIECGFCKTIYTKQLGRDFKIKRQNLKAIGVQDDWENSTFECDSCGAIEVINMNFPLEEEEVEKIEEKFGGVSEKGKNARNALRKLIRTFREV